MPSMRARRVCAQREVPGTCNEVPARTTVACEGGRATTRGAAPRVCAGRRRARTPNCCGPDFPIKDYIAKIAVEMTGERSGQMIWSMYFDTIEGQEFKRILPIVLPAINEASLTKLALILGGELISCVHDFSGLEADV